jgi:hypothetical protein
MQSGSTRKRPNNTLRRKIGSQGYRYAASSNRYGTKLTIDNINPKYFLGLVDEIYLIISKSAHESNIKRGKRLDDDILMLYTNLIGSDPDYKLADEAEPTIVNLRKNALKIIKDTYAKGGDDKEYAIDLFNRFMFHMPTYEKILAQKRDAERAKAAAEREAYERYKHTDAYKRSQDPYYGSGSTVDPYSGVSWGNDSGVREPAGGGGGGGSYTPQPWNTVYPEGWGGGRRRTKRRRTLKVRRNSKV